MARAKVKRRARQRRAVGGVPATRAAGTRTSAKADAGGPEVDGVETEGLSVTHWLTADPEGDPYAATVRFSGRRAAVVGKPGPPEAFVQDETVERIVPGSGPVSVTSIVYGLEPGEWTVSAEVTRNTARARAARAASGHTLPRAAWSWWRWSLSSGAFGPVRTRWGPLVRLTPVPAVVPGSWTALVATGVIVGALVHALLLARLGISVELGLLIDLLAVVAGMLGAKLGYLALRPRGAPRQPINEGWTVDGAVLAVPAVVVALLALDIPVGAFFDAGAPGLFLGVAIGRLGCFFTGCCAGRCTRSRWGIWSSDRRIGARRIPTQLLESATGLAVGAASLLLVLKGGLAVGGAIFIGGFAAYVLVRQVLLRLRADPHDPVRTRLTATAAALVLLADVLVALVGSL